MLTLALWTTLTIQAPDLPPGGLLSAGDPARLDRVLAQARRGEPISLVSIGGSITQGAKASRPELRYPDQVAAWLRQTFPQATVRFHNAGIGATGSNYGALRCARDVLAQRPDLVLVEYGVNDGPTPEAAETYEGLLRQILAAPPQPAVITMAMMNRAGGNAHAVHGPVATHYGLPQLSFRDALWPRMQAGEIRWEDYEADEVHPNDRGHTLTAELITGFLAQALERLPATLPAIAPLPAPLHSDRFARVELCEADALQPVANQGFTFGQGPGGSGWRATAPGSVLEFTLTGDLLYLMFWRIKGPQGRARVTVDDRPPQVCEAWFDQTWGGYRVTEVIGRGLPAGPHRIRIEVLAEHHAQSDGTAFTVLGLGAAGR
ncbi:MAG: hypothetical protein IT204_00725 [Fimbriimonadaceae bacterium]|nr:hypothetical protein [Fimbriimonadaceae bacterium]